jgi:hypothetical protein
VPDFLSPEWIAALDEAVSNDDSLRAATADVHLTVQQTVTGAPRGDVSWHVVVDDGTVHILPGPADHPDVTFTQDDATARAIGTSELSAQAAFMLGKLRIGGAVAKLIEHRKAFDELEDLFDDVRATTTY